jgi:hypothetical protein
MDTATAPRTTTSIYRLKAHGTCPATVIRVTFRPGTGIMPTHPLATFEDRGAPVALVPCDGCGKTYRIWGNTLRGRFSATKTCDSRCRNAVTADCECNCGGEHHGITHQ